MSLALGHWSVAALGFLAGFLAGLAFFAALRRTARAYAEGRVAQGAALQLVRFVALGLALYALTALGAAALLAAALGVVAARTVVLRRARREPG